MDHLFDLKKPCSNCPFRKDGKAIDLNPGRREGIISRLLTGKDASFPCHKTVHRKDGRNYDEEGRYKPTDVSVCPGAAAVCRKFGRDTVMVQVASRMGEISHDHFDQALSETMGPEDLQIDRSKVHL